MREIVLDASNWRSKIDLYGALLPAIGAPAWHGTSIAALVDTMIYGDVNAVEPPYVVVIRGTTALPADVIERLEQLRDALARSWRPVDKEGNEVDVSVRLEP